MLVIYIDMKCRQCGKDTEIKAFATFRNRKGEVRRRGVCLDCRGKYATDNFEKLQTWRKQYNQKTKVERIAKQSKRRQEAKDFTNIVKSKPCADCGQSWPPVAMDFDHVGNDKVKEIASMVSQGYKLDLIRIEIEKCEVVCACCHRLRTAARSENVGRPIAA